MRSYGILFITVYWKLFGRKPFETYFRKVSFAAPVFSGCGIPSAKSLETSAFSRQNEFQLGNYLRQTQTHTKRYEWEQ